VGPILIAIQTYEHMRIYEQKSNKSTTLNPFVDSDKFVGSDRSKGFTLIELLLYVSLSGIIIFSASAFMASLLASRVKNQTIAEVDQNGAQVMQIITQAVRNATAINSPSSGTSASTLSLNTTVPANNPTIFDLSGGAIRMTEGASAAVSLTSSRVSASVLNFQNLTAASTAGTIRISFVLTHLNGSGRNEYDYSKTFTGSASRR